MIVLVSVKVELGVRVRAEFLARGVDSRFPRGRG